MACISQHQNTKQKCFGYWSPPQKKIGGPNTTYFWWLCNSVATLRADTSSKEHDMDNRETALETTKGPLHRPKIEVWSKWSILTHPPKLSFVWRRRPSRWPAIRRANVSSQLLEINLNRFTNKLHTSISSVQLCTTSWLKTINGLSVVHVFVSMCVYIAGL